MKQFVIKYDYFGQIIEQTINIHDMISQLPTAIKFETVLELFELLAGDQKLEPFQIVVLKEHLKKIEVKLRLKP